MKTFTLLVMLWPVAAAAENFRWGEPYDPEPQPRHICFDEMPQAPPASKADGWTWDESRRVWWRAVSPTYTPTYSPPQQYFSPPDFRSAPLMRGRGRGGC